MKRLEALQGRGRYNFKDLVEAYSRYPVYEVIPGEEYRDYENGGEWVKEPPSFEELPYAAVVPLSREDYKLDEGGAYNYEDRKMYTYKDIEKGRQIKHKEKLYTVLERLDYSDFDEGLFIYTLKRGESN